MPVRPGYLSGCLFAVVLTFLLGGHTRLQAAEPSPQVFMTSEEVRVLFPQASSPDINTVYIPFSLVGQLMVVEASVDTVSGYFIVDTGSEHLVLNSKYYRPGPTARLVTSAGNTGMVNDVRGQETDSLHLQLLVIRGLFAHITNLDHIESKKHTRITGILGYEVFRAFQLFIDFPQRRIVLFRMNAAGDLVDRSRQWEQPYDSISFDLKKHMIQVEATVGTNKLKMILDSGAELNLIDRHVPRRVLDHFTIIKRVNLVGVGKKEVEVLAGVLRNVACGQQTCEKMNTLFTSLDDINRSFGAQADGVLGYEFLKNRRTLINYTKRKIYFFQPLRS